jgi:hypothetical protein
MNKKKGSTNSIFEEDVWLNVVAKEKWERIEIRNKNGKVDAAFPIFKTKKYGFKILTVPPLTQTMGIYIEDTGSKLTKKLEREKKLINNIIEELPKGYNYDFYLDVSNEYILPFLWNGFKSEPRFTYRIEDLSNLDEVWAGFGENIRGYVRKAEKIVSVKEADDPGIILNMTEKTFKRQNRKSPYNREMIKKLDLSLAKNNMRKLLYAVDDEGNIHAAAYFVYDKERCYYIMGGGDPDLRNSGAASLLIWEGIKFAAENSKIFDFEGSMIEDVERFVRGFGARPRVYFHVTKYNAILSLITYIKPAIKRLMGYK